MICPNCGRDYADPIEGRPAGKFYQQDDHFYKEERRFGKICFSCGFIAEIIQYPTGDPYLKRDKEADQSDLFGKDN